jgi:hypothetical protein
MLPFQECAVAQQGMCLILDDQKGRAASASFEGIEGHKLAAHCRQHKPNVPQQSHPPQHLALSDSISLQLDVHTVRRAFLDLDILACSKQRRGGGGGGEGGGKQAAGTHQQSSGILLRTCTKTTAAMQNALGPFTCSAAVACGHTAEGPGRHCDTMRVSWSDANDVYYV